SSWMYLETSSDGFTFTRRGRLDTLGGKASCDSAHGEDAYTIIYHDTLWTYYEYKGDYVPPCSRNPKCDRIGLCYSADNGLSWTFAGKVVDDSSTKFTWLISPSSPAAIVWDTSEVAYPDREHNIYLAVEVKGYFPGYVDCGGGMLALFGADHPLGVYDTVHCYPCSTALPTSFYRAAVPNQLFNVSDSLYVDAHCMHGPSSSWLHGRFRLSDDLQSLSSVRYFSNDSMLAGAIISQDILRDSSWMAWIPARNMPGTGVRYRTMFTNPNAVPSGWRGFRRNSNFGFHEARNGQLLLAAEPFRVDSGSPSIALISDTGFTNNFVIEYRMKLKWDTLSPAAVISAGSGQPASLTGYYSASAEMGMNSGYGIRYTNSAYYGNLFYLKPDSASKKLASEIIPDSLENTWRIHHLAYSGDTLRWWADGSASSLRPKAYTVLYKAEAKRIMLASGEGSARYGVAAPRGSQMAVDWLLVRKYHYPEPTITFGDVQAIPPQPTVVVQEEDGYVRLNWTNTGAPLYRVLCSTTLDGPYSLLFSTGDTTATVVRIDTAATGCFYQVVPASE
ncbi:MAG: hypothetical protein NT025_08570, partial [bacterium]|nr:hypothetical protein [bacterium]